MKTPVKMNEGPNGRISTRLERERKSHDPCRDCTSRSVCAATDAMKVRLARHVVEEDKARELTATVRSRFIARSDGKRARKGKRQQVKDGRSVKRLVKKLLPEVTTLLRDARTGRYDAVYIVGLPTDPETARYVMLGLSSLLGDLFNYDQQNDGQLLMELRPSKGSGDNTNSTADHFGLHSDDAAVPRALRTKFINLYGLINPPGTLTGYAPTLTALAAMRADERVASLVSKLEQPDFQVRVPTSFGLTNEVWSDPCALVTIKSSDDVETRFPSYAVRPTDDKDFVAHAAIAAFHAALRSAVTNVPLDPGCFLTFANDRGCHERGAIGEGDRLILRTYATDSMDELRKVTGVEGPVFPLAPIIKTLAN